MKITILTSDVGHPVYAHLVRWQQETRAAHVVELVTTVDALAGGDILFLISCHHIVRASDRARYRAALVVHASDVPRGRGWSPLAWQIVEGKNEIVVSLLEASDKVDRGDIWARETLHFEGHELVDEIHAALFAAELRLMDFTVKNLDRVTPRPQGEAEASYYRRRTPADSRLDPDKSIAEQFDLLRVADPVRFPAFVDLRGHRYIVRIEKAGQDR